jgi:hypothetical protein
MSGPCTPDELAAGSVSQVEIQAVPTADRGQCQAVDSPWTACRFAAAPAHRADPPPLDKLGLRRSSTYGSRP